MENFIEMLVSDKNAALDVYNALGDTAYTDTDKLTVDYIEEDVVCIRMEGDAAFVLSDIGEQETTNLPGLPAQCILYTTKAICAYLETMGGIELLDGPTQVKIPTSELPPPTLICLEVGASCFIGRRLISNRSCLISRCCCLHRPLSEPVRAAN